MNVRKRKAVAPVIATLLMIAVAVAMSVIIFMWSQGFLSQTSSATGGQQGSQNQAAQSSISIETATFTTGATGGTTIIVRNVGAVSVTMGALQMSGISSNTGFTGNIIASILTGVTTGNKVVTDSAIGGSSTDGTWNIKASAALSTAVAKGGAVTITLTGANAGATTTLASGDVVNVKITTSVGTFAQAQFTVP